MARMLVDHSNISAIANWQPANGVISRDGPSLDHAPIRAAASGRSDRTSRLRRTGRIGLGWLRLVNTSILARPISLNAGRATSPSLVKQADLGSTFSLHLRCQLVVRLLLPTLLRFSWSSSTFLLLIVFGLRVQNRAIALEVSWLLAVMTHVIRLSAPDS